MPAMSAPPLDGKGESCPTTATEAESWYKETNLDVCKRAPTLVLHVEPTARDVSSAFGNRKLPGAGWEGRASYVPAVSFRSVLCHGRRIPQYGSFFASQEDDPNDG